MTLRRATFIALPLMGLALWAEHAHGLAARALAFVHDGWLVAFVDAVAFRLFCL